MWGRLVGVPPLQILCLKCCHFGISLVVDDDMVIFFTVFFLFICLFICMGVCIGSLCLAVCVGLSHELAGAMHGSSRSLSLFTSHCSHPRLFASGDLPFASACCTRGRQEIALDTHWMFLEVADERMKHDILQWKQSSDIKHAGTLYSTATLV